MAAADSPTPPCRPTACHQHGGARRPIRGRRSGCIRQVPMGVGLRPRREFARSPPGDGGRSQVRPSGRSAGGRASAHRLHDKPPNLADLAAERPGSRPSLDRRWTASARFPALGARTRDHRRASVVVSAPPFVVAVADRGQPTEFPHFDPGEWLGEPAGRRRETAIHLPMVRVVDGAWPRVITHRDMVPIARLGRTG